ALWQPAPVWPDWRAARLSTLRPARSTKHSALWPAWPAARLSTLRPARSTEHAALRAAWWHADGVGPAATAAQEPDRPPSRGDRHPAPGGDRRHACRGAPA